VTRLRDDRAREEGMNIKWVALLVLFAALAVPTTSADRPYRAAAFGAAQWIESTAITDKTGVVWPADPLDPKTVNTTLYAGTPGPILLFLEASRYTGNKTYLEQARAGSDALMASISKEESTGLYEGIAGIGFSSARLTWSPAIRNISMVRCNASTCSRKKLRRRERA
jgi:lanthionine synthetase-like protein